MPPLPVTSQTLNCFLFGIYAQYTQQGTLLIPNGTGFVLGLTWVVIYPLRMDSSVHKSAYLRQIACLIAVSVVATIALYYFHCPAVPSSIGMVSGVLMSCYPVPVMLQAIQEKNAELL